MKRKEKHIPVHVGGLLDGIHETRIHVQSTDLDLPDTFDERISVRVAIDKSHSQILLKVRIRTEATYPCDRCFDPVVIPVDQSFTLVYAHNNDAARSFDDDDIRVLDDNEQVVDLADDVHDFAMLSIPMRITCGEDEQGNPTCRNEPPASFFSGGEDDIDPRWDTLRSLQSE